MNNQMVDVESSNVFKVGIDIHGVIDKMPDFFSFLSESIIKNGGEVHIITGGSWNDGIINELRSYGLKWTHYFSVYDYMLTNFEPILGEFIFPDGTVQKRFKNEDWDMIKAQYCEHNNISLHIDDKTSYGQYFTTPFSLLK
jgi:hypothetical protein